VIIQAVPFVGGLKSTKIDGEGQR